MKFGEVIELSKWECGSKTVRAGFKMPKGKKAVFLLIGTVEDGEDYDPNELLRKLGWRMGKEK